MCKSVSSFRPRKTVVKRPKAKSQMTYCTSGGPEAFNFTLMREVVLGMIVNTKANKVLIYI